MKKLLWSILLLITFCNTLFSQEIINTNAKTPTEFGEYIIPLWSKVSIELKQKKKNKYEYRIIKIEHYDQMYSFEKNEKLLSENIDDNIIEIYFIGAYYNEGKEDSDYKSLLMMKSGVNIPITFKADIKYYFQDNYENTSITATFPGAIKHEIWAHKIDFIKLYDFENLK